MAQSLAKCQYLREIPLTTKLVVSVARPGCVVGQRVEPRPWLLSLLGDRTLAVRSVMNLAHGLPLLPFVTISDFTSVPGQLRGNIQLGGKAEGARCCGVKAGRTLGVPHCGYCN